MPDVTRRRALLAVASGVTALAGCPGSEEHPRSEERRRIEDRPADRPIEDYETARVRNEDGAVLFTSREEIPTRTDDRRTHYASSDSHVLVSAGGAEELTFADVAAAERLRSFVGATDFDDASIYLFAMPVEACYEIRLRSTSVERDELRNDDLHPHADFCRTYRPADVECDADATHTVGFAIRLPVAAERSTGSGRGLSHSCGPSPRDEYFDAPVTPAGGADG